MKADKVWIQKFWYSTNCFIKIDSFIYFFSSISFYEDSFRTTGIRLKNFLMATLTATSTGTVTPTTTQTEYLKCCPFIHNRYADITVDTWTRANI